MPAREQDRLIALAALIQGRLRERSDDLVADLARLVQTGPPPRAVRLELELRPMDVGDGFTIHAAHHGADGSRLDSIELLPGAGVTFPEERLRPYVDLKPALWARRAVDVWLATCWRNAGG